MPLSQTIHTALQLVMIFHFSVRWPVGLLFQPGSLGDSTAGFDIYQLPSELKWPLLCFFLTQHGVNGIIISGFVQFEIKLESEILKN